MGEGASSYTDFGTDSQSNIVVRMKSSCNEKAGQRVVSEEERGAFLNERSRLFMKLLMGPGRHL